MSFIYAALSHSWSGLLIAAIVTGLGWLIVRTAIRLGRPRARFVGYAVYGWAALLTAGSLVAIVRVGSVERQYPPMGKLVDVGGYRMHILAQGEAAGRPTLVWIPGGHSQGIALYNYHEVMRGETRSILFDRPGTGWSDIGPFPRSTAREADELAKLLDNAGERGPFILIGHSYGGLLAANYARRRPDRTAALILLDPTHPDILIYSPAAGGAGTAPMVRGSQHQGLAGLFGIHFDPFNEQAQQDPEVARVMNLMKSELADVWAPLKALDAKPASAWTNASIFGEFSAARLMPAAPDLMVYDGELGDLPVFVVTPKGDMDRYAHLIKDEVARKRILNFIERDRMRYLSTSTRAQLIRAPGGTGHNFPYEAPDFVLGVVRQALAESSAPR